MATVIACSWSTGHGELVDGDELIVIIARERMANGNGVKGVVGTLMSNLGMEIAVREMGLEFVRAKVGDRYVMAELEGRGWTLGGEASGHIVCLDKTTTGDAVIAALQVLTAMVRTGSPLHELRQGMQKFPQRMVNVRVAQRSDPMAHPIILDAVKSAEARLADRGRVLLRASGTEPLIRVMVEGAERPLVEGLAEELASVVTEALA
jgi:phosphoglucosamine mutase